MPRDAGGNGNPTTFAGTGLSWDHENRLTGHGTALDAAYRGDGLRAWKEGAARTYFLYDGINVVCELDADGDLLAASTFGAAGLLSRGAVQYQFDPLGDAVHLLDGDGAVLANRLFDAWGNELTSGPFNPRGYRARYGYYADEETGLIALAYRYYGPGVGRFLPRDPIGYEGGVNLHAYVASSVVGMVDTHGLVLVCSQGSLCHRYLVFERIAFREPHMLGWVQDAGMMPWGAEYGRQGQGVVRVDLTAGMTDGDKVLYESILADIIVSVGDYPFLGDFANYIVSGFCIGQLTTWISLADQRYADLINLLLLTEDAGHTISNGLVRPIARLGY